MKPQAIVIGGGINGLVAVNYLVRNNFSVLLLEKKAKLGGACSQASITVDSVERSFANGASVLGFMQDFVFQETGLASNISTYSPRHPAIVYSSDGSAPCVMHDNLDDLTVELRHKWNENGRVAEFHAHLELVTSFLVDGFRQGLVPDIASAQRRLGKELSELWISGSARTLLDHYFTSEKMKLFYAVDVIESGPVSLDQPYSAFNISLMHSGTIFDGQWGFVKGGIWQITEELAQINNRLGVQTVAPAAVLSVAEAGKDGGVFVCYEHNGGTEEVYADVVCFATEPFTAAMILGDSHLIESVSSKNFLGTSGKCVLFFKQPVRWKQRHASLRQPAEDFDMAFRFLFQAQTLADFDKLAQAVTDGSVDYTPGFSEIYCEGAAARYFDPHCKGDALAVFFKNLALNKSGKELLALQHLIESQILALIENADDFAESVLFSPRDLQETFGFVGGNIDHIEMCNGQSFFLRNYSPHPEERFYQFGSSPNIYYGAAGSYPCGSIAGTAGYMCAAEMIRNRKQL